MVFIEIVFGETAFVTSNKILLIFILLIFIKYILLIANNILLIFTMFTVHALRFQI